MALVIVCGISAAAVPGVRPIMSGWWNSPERLAALPENPQVHYEPGAIEQARTVAATLPDAIARIEAIHGRRFAHPVTIGVYVSPEAFVAANGLGMPGAVGTTFWATGCCRRFCSPRSAGACRPSLRMNYLTHTSRAGFRNWPICVCLIGSRRDLPSWFRKAAVLKASAICRRETPFAAAIELTSNRQVHCST